MNRALTSRGSGRRRAPGRTGRARSASSRRAGGGCGRRRRGCARRDRGAVVVARGRGRASCSCACRAWRSWACSSHRGAPAAPPRRVARFAAGPRATSIQPPIPTIVTAAIDRRRPDDDVRRRARPARPTTSAARTRIPSVCDTATDRPSPTAWIGVPRVPTRYAAISVLPWPGVRAWPAPRANAVSERDEQDERGEVGRRGRSSGSSPPPTPPGTAPAPRHRAPASRRRDLGRRGGHGRSPPGPVADVAIERGRPDVERLADQVGRVAPSAAALGLVAGRPWVSSDHAVADRDDLAPADPLGVRGVRERDRRRRRRAAARAAAMNAHSSRSVESPPAPAGKLIAARRPAPSVAAVPSTRESRSADWRAQTAPRRGAPRRR